MSDRIIRALEYGICDVLTFNCGRRPLIENDAAIYRMIMARFGG